MAMGRFYHVIPGLVGVLLSWLLRPSWWAVAMIIAGVFFLWDWLWGDRRLLDIRYGIGGMALGIVLLGVAYFLARNLGMSLAEFQRISSGLKRSEGSILYMLPVLGVSSFLYGLIIFTLAVTRTRPGTFRR